MNGVLVDGGCKRHWVEEVIISETRVEISLICVLQDCSCTLSWRWRRLHTTVLVREFGIEDMFGRELCGMVTFPLPVEV